ncbi:fatty-acid amide hydrolase 2-B-like isoform X3 [Planococcus citri]|uniref:fatty-acid amide hydrolase 2-B-like isoform X3 n=1 Tax=Planococcus citri TaxID=170843 RepID=UPI0031F9AF77
MRIPTYAAPTPVYICTAITSMIFSTGVKRYEKRKAAYNGDAVQSLIKAGAIPIAVTSTPAYSLGIETFNDLIGYTANPYDSRKSSGGSSGGEAALIASAASVLGLGSDAGGSIRIPAAFCGIYGHKTSSNAIVSTNGHVTVFSQKPLLDMLSVGPLCRYAIDLQLAMDVLSDNKIQHSSMIDLQYIRIYHSHQFQRIFFAVDRTLSDKISQAATHFETQHNCLVKQINVEEFHKIPEISLTHFQKMTVLATEKDISTREARNCGNGVIKNILKLVANGWLKNIWAMSDESYTKQIHNLKTKLSELLGSNGVLLMPTWSESACYRYQSLSKTYNICYDYFTNALDLASTAVPVGYDCNDMPLSIQVVAARGCDHLCFKVAQELENLFGGWIPPYEHA